MQLDSNHYDDRCILTIEEHVSAARLGRQSCGVTQLVKQGLAPFQEFGNIARLNDKMAFLKPSSPVNAPKRTYNPTFPSGRLLKKMAISLHTQSRPWTPTVPSRVLWSVSSATSTPGGGGAHTLFAGSVCKQATKPTTRLGFPPPISFRLNSNLTF